MKITGIEKTWWSDDVRQFCIRHDYYTGGTNQDYFKMLNYVSDHMHPTDDDIVLVATDIYMHSTDYHDNPLENFNANVSFYTYEIFNEVVKYFPNFDINEE